MIKTNSAQNSEQTQTLDKLHKTFASVCYSYGELDHYYGFNKSADCERIDLMLNCINDLSKELKTILNGGAL